MLLDRRWFGIYVALYLAVMAGAVALFYHTAIEANVPIVEVSPPAARVSFIAGGDIMLSRGVARAIERTTDPLIPFSGLDQLLRSTDFNFANLESPIAPHDNAFGAGLIFNTKRRDIAGLKEYSFRALNLANNHALDQGLAGLRSTRAILSNEGLEHFGAGEDLSEAWKARIIEIRGVRIGFVGASYASVNDGGKSTNRHLARIEDTDRLAASIAEARTSGADLVVATMHAGDEYTREPNAAQKAFAHSAIDHGADIVIGSHPHWVQTIERYRGKLIFYSLGNMIFDQEWSRDTKEGLLLRITAAKPHLDPGGGEQANAYFEQIELIPIVIENHSTPRPATNVESHAILEKINEPSYVIDPGALPR